jgi:hypothetical protein
MNLNYAGTYRNLILYKSAVLCGAALLYGILPLLKTRMEVCITRLAEIYELTSNFRRGVLPKYPQGYACST